MPGDGESLPSGRVTFVLTDIEGSTRLLRRTGTGYAALLDRHRDLLAAAWAAHRGTEVDREGDGSLVAFADARDALLACAAAQRALQAEPWPPGAAVRVRMGLHTGLASPRAGGYVALAVHRAARVAHAAHGGQVLLSEEVLTGLDPEVRDLVQPLGRFRVRDFDAPVRLLQLTDAGLAPAFPAVRALPAEGHNLPRPLTRLVDRAEELALLAASLERARLVTLVGTGGVGKTRLAVEAGRLLAPRWPDGVWLADLAPLDDGALVPAAVAAAVGVAGVPGAEPTADVLDHLRSAEALLVLDNCEHQGDAVRRLVVDLLTECPGVRVLATSREPLHVAAERLVRLAPLRVPAPGDAGAADSPAVRLFTERAQDVQPGFALDAGTTADVVALCRRLDGLPLALEIAAARTAVLTPAEILTGLARRSAVLRGGDAGLPSRQRTLEALLDWSVRLLGEPERVALGRASLFGGSFGLDAATAALAGGSVEARDVPELVWSLVEKSLVVTAPAAGETRYRLLETVRAHGRDLLDARGDLTPSAVRLARWYAGRLGPARAAGRRWVSELGTELDTVRGLLPVVARTAQPLAQELACALGRHHEAVQALRQGVAETTRLAAELPAPTRERVGLLTVLADLHLRTGDVDAAERATGEARALRERTGAPEWDDVGLEKATGEIALRRHRPQLAAGAARRALAQDPSLRGRARMQNLLGIALVSAGDADGAHDAFQAELRACELLGDEVFLAHAHGNVAELALRRSDPAAAAHHQRACLDLAVALGQPGMVASSLLVAARLAAAEPGTAAWCTAVRLTGKAEEMLDDSGLALYDEDRALTERTLAAAHAALGPQRFTAECGAGRAADVGSALEEAGRVLTAVSTRRPALPEPRVAVGAAGAAGAEA